MSESERDRNPAGDIATRTSAQRAGADKATDAAETGAAPGRAADDGAAGDGQGNGADPYAHHALGAPPAEPEYAPVIPLRRPSMLHDEPPAPRNVRIRKLRVFGVLLGLGVLAVVSTVFGM